ncbi:hypothetical protein P167DRAFT_530461 [Morchella conica CCBAS932]|uniref:Pre-rRNA processing protein n=2 Tax=Morchella sect. Distantes TaxID=1051054 RepID=A0A3N4KF36_9PEZI|nr:hypothetical protein P167DRAFT_530461 [Morchella conica CCBAS932]
MSSLKPHRAHSQFSEETPLLRNGSSALSTTYNGEISPCLPNDGLPSVFHASSESTRRPASRLALIILCTSILTILCIGFFVPAAASQYAKEALILDISSLSIEGFTDRGVRARVQARVTLDAGRVRNNAVLALGRVGTWIVRRVSSEHSKMHVYLPDYGEGLLGTATTPAMELDIRNGQITLIDFVSEVETGSLDILRSVVNDYLTGNIRLLRVRGEANLGLKAGLFNLGTQKISEELVFEEFPSLPQFEVKRLNFEEIILPKQRAVNATASITLKNPYPLQFGIPSISFNILLPGCDEHKLVHVATAKSLPLHVEPQSHVDVEISSIIHNLPGTFINACPESQISPMDKFLGAYLHGDENTVFVRGSDSSGPNVPGWLQEILQSITVLVPFQGHAFNDAVKSFSLSNVSFQLPTPDAEPGSPESSPRLGASVVAIVRTPEEINLSLYVKRLRAIANVSYEGGVFGALDLRKWMVAESSRSSDNKYLEVHAEVKDAPLNITNYDIFRVVVKKMLSGEENSLQLGIRGDTDVDVKTSLGEFVVSNIPVTGNITIDHFPGFGSMPSPKARKVVIEDTAPHSVTLRVDLSINNPTPWGAIVPYMNVNITQNDTVLGNASVHDVHILPGNNLLTVWAIWDPRTHGGSQAGKIGAHLLGEYISGQNTTITIRPHVKSLPSLPLLSDVLSNFELTIPTPRLGGIDEPDGNTSPRFIESATIHVLSSTADFVIDNPLRNNAITIKKINGTAKYNGSDLGTILYEWPFNILPGKQGKTLTPKLPVDWGPDNVGYGVVKKALRGQLKVHAEALCMIGIGNFSVELFYNGSRPIGAHVGF